MVTSKKVKENSEYRVQEPNHNIEICSPMELYFDSETLIKKLEESRLTIVMSLPLSTQAIESSGKNSSNYFTLGDHEICGENLLDIHFIHKAEFKCSSIKRVVITLIQTGDSKNMQFRQMSWFHGAC